MSDMATRPNERKASVVPRTSAPRSAERRSKRSAPSQAVASRTPIEARTGHQARRPRVVPSPFIAAAISQYVRTGLSKNGSPS